jgi:hypothetical protein
MATLAIVLLLMMIFPPFRPHWKASPWWSSKKYATVALALLTVGLFLTELGEGKGTIRAMTLPLVGLLGGALAAALDSHRRRKAVDRVTKMPGAPLNDQ